MARWKASKAKAREYAQQMEAITDFCLKNNIQQSMTSDSYYFQINGQNYRVSNHTVAASDKGMYDEFGRKIRDSYHTYESDDTIYITASKTRIMAIYNDLKNGYELDKRGNRK